MDTQRRVLSGPDGQPISLTPRLFDALLYFVERPGELLTKEQLLENLWPKVVVEEHNLNKTVSELRRLLGEKPGEHRFIVTKPGHGYRFVAHVSIDAQMTGAGGDGREAKTDQIEPAAAPSTGTARTNAHQARLAALGSMAAALALVGGWAYIGDGGSRAIRVEEPAALVVKHSVAVLPFVDRSADGRQTWLADGLAEEILNSLARLPELKVTSRSSSYQFRDANRDIREVAERLGVENVLEGSVQSAGDQLQVTAQLIRAADGFHLWSNRYDGTVSDLFSFQRDVAERVVAALDIVLDDSRRSAMFASGTQNVEAFREHQEGWRIYHLVHTFQTQQTLWDANRHFERAMELDPHFGLAGVGRTDAFAHFLIQPAIPFVANPPYSREQALQLLRQTLGFVTDNSATPTMRLAYQLQNESLSPSWDRMWFLLTELRRQWDVDALTFAGGVDRALWLPQLLWAAGQYDLVRALAERQVMNDPLFEDAWSRRVNVELHARDFDAARESLEQARGILGRSVLPNEEFRIALLEGDRANALELLQVFPNREGAMVMAALNGDRAVAMPIADEMEKRYETLPAGAHLGGLLYAYYELGEVERSRTLVKRIDESLVGAQVFMQLLGVNGGVAYFDFADAPNFVAKLRHVRVDANAIPQMTRLSTLP